MLGIRDSEPLEGIDYSIDLPLLITVQSKPSEEADSIRREIIFGVYDLVKTGECGDSFGFTTSAVNEYTFGWGGALNLLQLKHVYAVLTGTSEYADGATITIDGSILDSEFKAPLEWLTGSGCIVGIEKVFGEKYRTDGLSLAIVIPPEIGIDGWLMKFMVEHFKCETMLK